MRVMLVCACVVGMSFGVPPEVVAQGARTRVGVALGGVRTTQIWKPTLPVEDVTGILAGAFVDAPTSIPGLSILAEGSYTRRGGDVTLDVSGQPAEGRLRVDYLTVAVHLKVARSFGPVRAHLSLGPTLDQVLRSRLDPVLTQVLEDEKAVVFGAAVGGGLGTQVNDRLFVGVDVRHLEGLSDAHSGNFASTRNRSLEVLFRASVPLDVLRSR